MPHTKRMPTLDHLNRRDFLKLAASLPAFPLLTHLPDALTNLDSEKQIQAINNQSNLPNIIIIIYDAFSAQHLSLEGYPRHTTPNIDQFASQATVYHNHHSAGNFTTPSTASLFYGVYPWTHRALSLGGLSRSEIVQNNLFQQLGGLYHRLAFTQNIFVDQLLFQFPKQLESHPHLDSFSAAGFTFYNKLFPKDAILGLKSFDEFLFIREQAHGSLFLGLLNDLTSLLSSGLARQRLKELYPEELPRLANTDVYYTLDKMTQGVSDTLHKQEQPFFAYLHLMPPHEPYVPSSKYKGSFADGWAPDPQKKHRLGSNLSVERMNERRQVYDEFIANLDHDFGRLLSDLKRSGLMQNSYIIFTSDHGEMFEKGVVGHSSPLLFEPGVRVPLIIAAPGQMQHQDIYALTSTVDLLPSLLSIAGKEPPAWCQGQFLPGLQLPGQSPPKPDPNRSIYIVEAKKNPAYQPLSKATLAVMQWPYKLVHYLGYKNYMDAYELYDLEADPNELKNIYQGNPVGKRLKEELAEELTAADQEFK